MDATWPYKLSGQFRVEFYLLWMHEATNGG